MLEGLPPNNATHMMRLGADEATTRAVADIVFESYDPAEVAASSFELQPNMKDWSPSHEWAVEVYFGFEPDEDEVRELVAVVAGPELAKQVTFRRVEQKDWIASSLEGLKPVRVGRFLVHGSHDRDKVRSNDIGLEIEAALAFGTGHHGTTRGCLIMFDSILKRRRPQRIVDIGAGTGVLALAAARYLHINVAGGDIDPIAVRAARSNAKLNGATPWFFPVTAKGLGHPAMQAGAPYDLIFANILAKPLRQMAPSIGGVAATDTYLILSGLLMRDVPGVLSAYAAQGFRLARRIEVDGWATLLMRNGGASPRPLLAID